VGYSLKEKAPAAGTPASFARTGSMNLLQIKCTSMEKENMSAPSAGQKEDSKTGSDEKRWEETPQISLLR